MKSSNYPIIAGLLAGILTIVLVLCVYVDSTPDAQPVEIVPTKIATEPREIEVKTITREERTSLGEFTVTAYCPCNKCCGAWADGLTYTETVATEGRTIAVDPRVIPLGSTVEINGVRYVAEDIGGAIKSDRVDIYFNNHEDAREWGVQECEIFLIELPKLRE